MNTLKVDVITEVFCSNPCLKIRLFVCFTKERSGVYLGLPRKNDQPDPHRPGRPDTTIADHVTDRQMVDLYRTLSVVAH